MIGQHPQRIGPTGRIDIRQVCPDVHVVGPGVQARTPAQDNITRRVNVAASRLWIFRQCGGHAFLHDQPDLVCRQGPVEEGHIVNAPVVPVIVLPDVPSNPEIHDRRDRSRRRGGRGPGLSAVQGDHLRVLSAIQDGRHEDPLPERHRHKGSILPVAAGVSQHESVSGLAGVSLIPVRSHVVSVAARVPLGDGEVPIGGPSGPRGRFHICPEEHGEAAGPRIQRILLRDPDVIVVSIEEQTPSARAVLSPGRAIDEVALYVKPAGIRRDRPRAVIEPPPADKVWVRPLGHICLNESTGKDNDNQMDELSRHDRPPSEVYSVRYPILRSRISVE